MLQQLGDEGLYDWVAHASTWSVKQQFIVNLSRCNEEGFAYWEGALLGITADLTKVLRRCGFYVYIIDEWRGREFRLWWRRHPDVMEALVEMVVGLLCRAGDGDLEQSGYSKRVWWPRPAVLG